MVRAGVCALLAVMLCAPRPALGGAAKAEDLFEAPPGVVGWWAFDPARFASAEDRAAERRLLEAGMQAALSAGLIRDQEAAYAVAALLGASVAGSSPHRVCVLDFRAEPEADGNGMAVQSLQMVLELRTREDHRRLVGAIRSIVIEAEDVEEDDRPAGAQRTEEVAPGREAVIYTRSDWPAWREVSWHSGPGAFTIGLGRGALARWFALRDAEVSDAPRAWDAHLDALDAAGRPRRAPFLRAYCDIDALRRGFPEAFQDGRAVRLLGSLGLANARDLMVHGAWVDEEPGPNLLALDASWSPRSRPPGDVRTGAITSSAWPEEASMTLGRPPGSYAMVVRGEWMAWLGLGVNAYAGTMTELRLLAFRSKAQRWVRTVGPVYQRLSERMGPWVVLSDVPRPPVPVPGLSTVFAEARPGQDAGEIEAELEAVLRSLGDERVVRDERTGVWSLRVLPEEADPAGVVRAAAFAVVDRGERPPVVVISWSPAAAAEARAWLLRE